MLNQKNQLASVNVNKANEIAIEFEKIMQRFNQIRNSINFATCDQDFVEAYSGLCEQLFDLANQIAVSQTWVDNGQLKKLAVLGDKMRLTSEHVNCLYRQIEESGKLLVFNFRRAA